MSRAEASHLAPAPKKRRRWLRMLVWVVVVLALVFYGAGGWYFSDQLRADGFDVKPHQRELRASIAAVGPDTVSTEPRTRRCRSTSRELAASRPDLVTLVEFEGAKHVQSWNLDQERIGKRWSHSSTGYDSRVVRLLTRSSFSTLGDILALEPIDKGLRACDVGLDRLFLETGVA